ncbi:group-specific protein [Gracilibacillus timonensis]|uniref:group-specific protein n=1 Tax=Gracilibacillus timonensis TaxID=1816696 RepID=UPI000825C142|nr:group-specific protein [Gracilibacillus timonensis]
MGTGIIISFIVSGIWLLLILAIMIPFHRKHVIKENGKINYKKTTVYLRWNVFDTLTMVLAVYTVLCAQILFFLLADGETGNNNWVQFFSNQTQGWVLICIIYLVSRVSLTIKSAKAHLEDLTDEEQ